MLLAESILWMGFGALLPVLPLYLTERGIDPTTLGFIVAAWPAARLVAEPAFGWLADRTDRRALMVIGLVGTAAVIPLPLVVGGAPAFIVLRAIAGCTTAAYDPAARGYLLDAVPPDRRGWAFGLYSGAQMGGFLLGPAIGGAGAMLGGGYAVPFILSAAATLAAAVAVGIGVRRFPVTHAVAIEDATAAASVPRSLLNRLLLAAILVNIGSYFASGTYDVIWSLWLTGLGANLGLVGLTFAAFGVGVVLLSPLAGRVIDRTGPLPSVIGGSLVSAVCGLAYSLMADPTLALPLVITEGAGFAFLGPALFTLVARGTPAGRSSTAQGLFGGAGTLGFVIASLAAGALYTVDHRYPFYAFSAVMVVALAAALAVGGRALRSRSPGRDPAGDQELAGMSGAGLDVVGADGAVAPLVAPDTAGPGAAA